MDQTVETFFNDFRQELLAGAEANSAFQLSEFMESVAHELMETGFIEGFEFCHYRSPRAMRVDGYWFDDEGTLNLFVADFDCREELASLTRTDVDAAFKRLVSFFQASTEKELYKELDIVSPEYGLSRQIADQKSFIRKVNFFLISERLLSDRIQEIDANEVAGKPAMYHIWDISRLHRQRSSRGHKEMLNLDFREMFGIGISCLPAHLGSNAYQSYLLVMPASTLADLYGLYGSRLLEQNVRCFLQARGNVNKGIRTTILTEPQMFFAYNNGITATAREIEVEAGTEGLSITRILDLQIVNGGQTTASLFHTRRKDKASLDNIFVQMKLSVIDSEESEKVVPRISEYANTQNRVNAADFFSNHPFHIRFEDNSRRIWAPAQEGAQRETKWFYERARGQYADAQAKLTPAEQRRFKAENPKPQMITKTDLAKFENVWDDHPRFVNLGAQKNFARYAARIGKEWKNSSDSFNERYFKRAIARAVIFRATEKLVSSQPWYNGGYRANIVAYTLALLGEVAKQKGCVIDFMKVWDRQALIPALTDAIVVTSSFVNEDLIRPPQGISNISEWAKKEACWTRLQGRVGELEKALPSSFLEELVPLHEVRNEQKNARKTQQVDNGIDAQTRVCKLPPETWGRILRFAGERGLLTPKERGVVEYATHIPGKIPSEKQSLILLDVLEKVREEGFEVNSN